MSCNHLKSLVVFLLLSAFLCFSVAGAEETKKIAVFPFHIYSDTDASYLKERLSDDITTELLRQPYVRVAEEEAVTDRIGGRTVTEALALSVGKDLEVDYVIMGSLTRLGNLISTDVQVVDVERESTIRDLYFQGRGLESVGSISRNLVEEVLFRLFAAQRVAEVRFEGNRRIEEGAILNVIQSVKGTLFSQRLLSEDIRSIYGMGFFSDVAASVEDSTEGRVITFTVTERPRIAQILIEGNRKIKENDIRDVISAKTRQMFNPERVNTDAENIELLYKERGYLNVEVAYTAEADAEGQDVYVTFTIVEHRKPSIRTISFEGNMVYTDKDLKKMMKASEWGIFSFLTDAGLYNRTELQADIENLTVFYHNNGFIDAQIGDPEISIDDRWIYVTIPVQEGRQYQVGDVGITGDELDVSRDTLMTGLEIRKKDFFDREAIIRDMEYLTTACNNEGYAYANVIPRTVPSPERQKIDITYHIEKGRIVHIDRISITGNTRTRDKVIRRELAVIEGQLYSRDNLTGSYEGLNRLQYFEEVNFQTEPGADESLMDVNVHVSEKATGLFSVGAGYSTIDKVIFMAEVAERNLFGRGQTISAKGYVGSATTNYEISFIEPWLFDIPLWSKAELWKMERERDTYDVYTKGLAGTLGYRLFERVDGYIRYRLSENIVKNISPYASRFVRDQEGKIMSSGLTITLVRDTRHPWMMPSRGSRNSVAVEFTGGPLQGDASFTRYSGETRWFFPVVSDYVFSVAAQFGLIHGNEGKEVPIYERFYLGGIGSLRGLRDVGPRSPDNLDVIGGKTMMVYTAEFLFPLLRDAGIRGVIFYDTGNSWESGFHFDDMRQTAGAGVRWNSPIGPFRLEWGYVLDRKEGESPSRWEFTIGMMF
ncbi:MAG: outer membrane protein assembly factor BamA [Syntrophales bacterium]|jgi:outer membrane protein insertion porin family|nr:outer membrane protein assembly factor BamA [Syntrophales bacterium]MCK9527721.1 outer membrane protein assembly factor BamA [Syntrophales bacterium]MDX9921624.1 outer membrane protein assembly factor BamA [Syntrophales bacterium]